MTFSAETGKILFFACMYGQEKSVFYAQQYKEQQARFLEGGLRSLPKLIRGVRSNQGDAMLSALRTKIPSEAEMVAILEEGQFDELRYIFQILFDSRIALTIIQKEEAAKIHTSELDWNRVKARKRADWFKYHQKAEPITYPTTRTITFEPHRGERPRSR